MLGELATHLSHELRQPLATINMTVQNVIAAMEEGPTHDVRPRLERIIRYATRAGTLIDRLRRLSCKQDLKPTLETFSLETVVDDALLMTEYALDEAGVTVELALGEPVPIIVGHALLLGQVLSNLFLNARDAMTFNPPGRPRLIRVSVIVQSETSVLLTVADTGPGIAPGVLDRLFEPFVTTKPPAIGTGLGLSISKAHVVQMGGDLEAHSDSRGAAFTITLLRAGGGERSVSEEFAPSSGDAMR
jgi:C4-dicarboxylate-specific signal transduction histidine kinase